MARHGDGSIEWQPLRSALIGNCLAADVHDMEAMRERLPAVVQGGTMNPATRRVLLLSWSLLATIVAVDAVLLDIHLPLKSPTNEWQQECPYSQALESNRILRHYWPQTEQVDFFTPLHIPHVTLYQVEFDLEKENATIASAGTADHDKNDTSAEIDPAKLEVFLDTLYSMSTAGVLPQCEVVLAPPAIVFGAYTQWPVQPSDCLQILSDAIVDELSKFIKRPPIIPDWVWTLPEPQRSSKLDMIQRYGSPNVYSEFQPHATVGFDTTTPTNNSTRRARIRAMNRIANDVPKPCGGMIRTAAVAKVGVGGTVLADGKVGRDLPLQLPDGESVSDTR